MSSNTSLDDKTDDFGENPTRDILAEGLMSILKPTLDQLDDRVKTVRVSQLALKEQLDALSLELKKLSEELSFPVDLNIYSTKLANCHHKISVVSNILQAAQDRLHKVQVGIHKDLAKRKAPSSPQVTPT